MSARSALLRSWIVHGEGFVDGRVQTYTNPGRPRMKRLVSTAAAAIGLAACHDIPTEPLPSSEPHTASFDAVIAVTGADYQITELFAGSTLAGADAVNDDGDIVGSVY